MREVDINLSTSNAATLAAVAELLKTSVESLSSSLLRGSTNPSRKSAIPEQISF